MALRHVWPSLRGIFFAACAVSLSTVARAAIASAQDTTPPPNACKIDIHLKLTKIVHGAYSEEAFRKSVDGKVVMCVTVSRDGKVTDVKTVSGPRELIQSTIDAIKQWQFEPPTNAPVMALMEVNYTLTKPCPGGGKGVDTGDVKVNIEPGHIADGEHGEPLKIIANVSQAQLPYPDKARTERRRGQLYLSISVNGNGDVVDGKIVMPLDELLDKTALDTVRTWKFKVNPPGGKTTVFPVTLSFQIPCLDHPEDR
jgi:TonB family protein